MSEFAGGAAAPAEAPAAAPITEAAPASPQPLGSQTPVADKPEPAPKPEAKVEAKPEAKEAPSKSSGDALRKAAEAIKAKEAEAKPVAKVEAKEPVKVEGPTRTEDGKFAAKEQPAQAAEPKPVAEQPAKPQTPRSEPPSRFSADAKAAWETAPEPVRAESIRAIKELEDGIQKYRTELEPLKPYQEIARREGTTVHAALDNYVNLAQALKTNPERGMQMVADFAGINLRDMAAKIMGQTPDQVRSQQDNTVQELKREIAALKEQVGGVTTTIQQQRTSAVESEVQKFASEHPRFDELAEDIKFFISSGRTNDLSEAYSLAERLNPAPAPQPNPVASSAPVQPAPLNPAGFKSVSGAPSAGSDPVRPNAPIPSNREALERAMSRAGRI